MAESTKKSSEPSSSGSMSSTVGMATEGATASEDRAETQVQDASWPQPGDEGYVHPDGTPQSVGQLEANRQAAADRAAVGSAVHGAPLATPGPDPEGETAKAAARADQYADANGGHKEPGGVAAAQRVGTDDAADKTPLRNA